MNFKLVVLGVGVLSSIAWSQAAPSNISRNGGDFSNGLSAAKVPSGVILVKGAWSSASDSTTPVPEGGTLLQSVYKNDYFGMSYSVRADWTEI